jgi:hypothetical protein
VGFAVVTELMLVTADKKLVNDVVVRSSIYNFTHSAASVLSTQIGSPVITLAA